MNSDSENDRGTSSSSARVEVENDSRDSSRRELSEELTESTKQCTVPCNPTQSTRSDNDSLELENGEEKDNKEGCAVSSRLEHATLLQAKGASTTGNTDVSLNYNELERDTISYAQTISQAMHANARADAQYAGSWAVNSNQITRPGGGVWSDTESADNSPSRMHHVHDHSDQILARAQAVEEISPGDLPQAEEVTTSTHNQKTKPNPGNTHSSVAGIFVIVIVIVFVTVMIVVFSADREGEESDDGSYSLDTYNQLTTEDYILSLLPDSTVERIDTSENTVPSAQTRAFQWVLNDPWLYQYKAARIIQRFALATLFYATGGELSWNKNDGWLSYEVGEADWYIATTFHSNPLFEFVPPRVTTTIVDGFLRDQSDDEIRHIWLYANGLQGTLPPEIFLMTSLRTFDIAGNGRLTGSLPSEIGKLENLEVWSMFFTSLSGRIPSEIGNMKSLLLLLSLGSGFSGSLPTELGRLDPWVVSIGGCRHTGPIPSELGLWTNVLTLQLYGNELTGSLPTELGQMESLHLLELNDNYLSGSIPTELGMLTSSTDFSVYTAYADNWFFGMESLTVKELNSFLSKGMAFDNNLLTGTIPSSLGRQTASQFLTTYSNYLSGPVPSELGLMTDLETLLLSDNALTSTIPKELSQLNKLVGLALSDNLLTGTIPEGFTQMEALNVLTLQNNNLSGTVPSFGNQFASDKPFPGDSLPSKFWNRSVEGAELDLSGNKLVGSLPSDLIGKKLVRLALNDNELTGTIPANLGRNDFLKILLLNGNRLSGTLPPEMGNWASLEVFSCGSNTLTGNIPRGVEDLVLDHFLEVFDVSNNTFEGTLPDAICALNTSTSIVFLCEDSLCGCDCPCGLDSGV